MQLILVKGLLGWVVIRWAVWEAGVAATLRPFAGRFPPAWVRFRVDPFFL
jgi:hypothetical protein